MSTKEIGIQVFTQVASTLIVGLIFYLIQRELAPKNQN